MVRDRKWLKNSGSRLPVSRVAHDAVLGRLRTFWRYLKLAAKKPQQDPEYVHQLRVAARRATAALDVFADSLPAKRRRRVRKVLHRVRRAAGAARDLDVMQNRLAGAAGLDHATLRMLKAQRRAAQKPLKKAYRDLRHDQFPKHAKALAKRARWRGVSPEPTFDDAAKLLLSRAIEQFYSAATIDKSDLAAMHHMRVAGKRLRYTLELLADAAAPSLRHDVYPVFADVQERLGTINDRVTAKVTYTKLLDHVNGSLASNLQALIEREDIAVSAECEAFFSWWTPSRASDLRERFVSALEPRTAGGSDAVL